jgi:hypothetical protein
MTVTIAEAIQLYVATHPDDPAVIRFLEALDDLDQHVFEVER